MLFSQNTFFANTAKKPIWETFPNESDWHHVDQTAVLKATPSFSSSQIVKITPSAVPMKHRKAFTIGNTADLYTMKVPKRGAERDYRGKQWQRHERRLNNNVLN
jgi:hypothetical protein